MQPHWYLHTSFTPSIRSYITCHAQSKLKLRSGRLKLDKIFYYLKMSIAHINAFLGFRRKSLMLTEDLTRILNKGFCVNEYSLLLPYSSDVVTVGEA